MAEIYIPEMDSVSLNTEAVDGQIASSETVANDTYSAISGLMAASGGAGIVFDAYTPGVALTTIGQTPVPYTDYVGYTYDDEVFLGEVPSIPDLSITLGTMPEMSFSKPAFNIPPPPDITWPTFTEDPPAVSAVDIPTAPTVVLPDPPALNEIDIPAPPSASVPEFAGVEPNIDLTPPDVIFAWTEDQYSSALMTALTNRMETDMALGGQGYSTAVEQATYDREESRVLDEEEDAYAAILGNGVGRGFMLPPGNVVGNILKLSDKVSQNREELNNRLVTEQTTLALKNTHDIIAAAVKSEAILIGHHNNVQQRSFEAAKFALSAAMEIYGAKAEAYKAKVEVYAVLAKVYDAKIRAEIVKAELYKAHIEGLKVGVEVNNLKVQRYKAQLQGVKALVEMYRAEMQAGHVIAEVERTRMQGYLARVEAYMGRIAAIKAEADAYVAQVRGEEIKADMIKADADAYKAEMRAYEAQAQVEVEEAKAQVEALRAKLITFNAQVDKYAAEIARDVGVGKASERLKDAQAQLRVHQARYQAATIDLDAALHHAQTVEGAGYHRAKAISEEAEQTAKVTIKRASAQGERAANEAATAIAVASNAAFTTSVSKSHRQSATESRRYTESERESANLTHAITVGFSNIYQHSA